MTRQLLFASAIGLGLLPFVGTQQARANLQICVSDDGGTAVCSAVDTTGSLTFSPTGLANFANITVATSGVPVENNPDLATTDLTADTIAGFTGSHTLEIQVFQTGLTAVDANLQSTFTINGLIGTTAFPGPSTLSDYTGGTGTNLGNPLHSMDFGAVAQAGAMFGPTNVNGVTSDAQDFFVTFSQPGQSVTDTIQTVGVAAIPEPSTLAVFGAGLIGLAALRLRRRA